MPIILDQKIKQFNLSVPRSLAIREYFEGAIDLAISLTRENTADGLGLAHLLLSPAQLTERFPPNIGEPNPRAPIILARPALLPLNASAVEIYNDKHVWDAYNAQQVSIPYLENQIELGYPEDIRSSLEVNFSLRHSTLQEQFVDLFRLNPVSDQDINWLKSSISCPFPKDGNIAAFTSKQKANLDHLARIGQPMASLEAIRLMFSSHQSNDEDKLDYAVFMTNYEMNNGILQRTVLNYISAIISFVNNVLPSHRQTNLANRAILFKQSNEALQLQVAAAAVIHPKSKQHSTNRFKNNLNNSVKQHSADRTIPLGKPKFYCWTCGIPAEPKKQHYSNGCFNPAAGHQWDATFENQLGGKKT